jgi:hypothetical protein
MGQNTQIPLEQSFAGSESRGRFNGSATFTETQFPINPGQAGTFPWLSQEAKLWEKYEFDSLKFEFRTTINEFSTNALGRVILGVDFDAADPPPSTRSEAEISRPVTAQAPYFNQMLTLRKQDMSDTVKRHYVRPGNLPGGSDIKMYDVGNLNFGTDGNVNANEVGELWVHYTGKFFVQVLEATITPPNNNQVVLLQQVAPLSLSTGVNTVIPFDTEIANGLAAVNSAGSIVLPEGNYVIDAQATYTTSSGGVILTDSLFFEIAGTPIPHASSATFLAAAGVTDHSESVSWFFQSLGASTPLNVTAVVDLTGGACTVVGALRILSV